MRGVRPTIVAAAVVLLSGSTVTGLERPNRLTLVTSSHSQFDYE